MSKKKAKPRQTAPEPETLLKVRHELGQTIAVGLPHPDEALQIYKQLGPTRSMAKIQIYLTNMGRRAPAVGTLKAWSKKNNWGYHAREYDLEITRQADAKLQAEQAGEIAKEVGNLATKMRNVAHQALKRMKDRIDSVPIKSGGEFKAVAEAAVALNKAAEVLDGGVSDRTERMTTIEERKDEAADIVNKAFKNFAGGGNDNGKRADEPVDNAADAGRGAA